MSELADMMKSLELEQQVTALKLQATGLANVIREAIMDIEEGNVDDALDVLKQAIGE